MSSVLRESVIVWTDNKMTVKIWRVEEDLHSPADGPEMMARLSEVDIKPNEDGLALALKIMNIPHVSRVEVTLGNKKESYGVSLSRD